MIRSKAYHTLIKGKKPTKYFCGLEKHNYTSKIIGKIKNEDGSMIVEQNEILKETEIFYKNLYENKDDSLDTIDLNDLMKDTEMPTLTNDEAEKIEGLLTYKEISEVLFNMKHDKSPGITGFTAEFFKFFLETIRIFCVASNQLWIQKGRTFNYTATRHHYMYSKGKQA